MFAEGCGQTERTRQSKEMGWCIKSQRSGIGGVKPSEWKRVQCQEFVRLAEVDQSVTESIRARNTKRVIVIGADGCEGWFGCWEV